MFKLFEIALTIQIANRYELKLFKPANNIYLICTITVVERPSALSIPLLKLCLKTLNSVSIQYVHVRSSRGLIKRKERRLSTQCYGAQPYNGRVG